MSSHFGVGIAPTMRAFIGLEGLEPRLLMAGDGLKGEYFNNKDLTALVTTRTDPTVDFLFKGNAPAPGVDKDTFSIRWTGFVEPLYSQTYTFQTASDDGVRLWVNDQLLINQWTNHAVQTHTGTIALQAGQKYSIRMEHYDNLGDATARLWWSSASQPLQIIPQSQLYSSGTVTPQPGTIAFTSSSANVNENAGNVTLNLTRSGGSSGAVSVNYALTPGSATANDDYDPTGGTVTFADGQTSRTIVVPIVDDTQEEPNETFIVTISNPQGGAAVGSPSASTVTILANDAPTPPPGSSGDGLKGEYFDNKDLTNLIVTRIDPKVDFLFKGSAPAPGVAADTFSIRWTGFVEPLFSQTYTFQTTSDDGVRLWVNDQLLINQWTNHAVQTHTGTIALQAGQKYAIRMEHYDNLGDATARLWWSSASQPLQIIPQSQLFSSGVVTPQPGAIAWAQSAVSVDEAAGTVTLTLNRTGGSSGPVSIDYTMANGSAVSPDDYTAATGTIDFADGQTSRTLVIPIINDSDEEAAETFTVTLSNPGGGASLGSPATATVTILANDAPPSPGVLQLESNSYTVDEDAGTVTLAVTRTGGSAGEVGIDYNTIEGTAIPGEDYTDSTGTVIFPDGVTRKTFTIPIINNSEGEPVETFGVSLDNIIGGASLSQPRTATVTILDDDGGTDNGDGLRGQYYDDEGFTVLKLTRVDSTVNFSFGSGSPASGIGSETFSVRWTGQVLPKYTETYTFTAASDDGVRVWVNNQLVLEDWGPHALRNKSGTIALQAGRRYNIRMDYYERSGNATAKLSWSSPSQALEVIPQSQLFSTGYTGDPGIPIKTTPIVTGLELPTTARFLPNGTMLIAQKDGLVKAYKNGQLQSTPFIDLRSIVNNVGDRGLLGMAVHPDFPTQPYVYLLYTYDPPETLTRTGYGGPDGLGNRGGRLMRVTADVATGYATAVPNSGVVILGTNSDWEYFGNPEIAPSSENEYGGYNPDGTYVEDSIPVDSESHTIGDLAFLPDGSLLVTSGDGTAFGKADLKAARVQDPNSLNGKLMRIDPITGEGLPDNPFYNGDPDSNRSKVVAVGFRNPFRIAVNPDNGKIYVGDVGWKSWEEINLITVGANYGWPWYEGAQDVLSVTPVYAPTNEAQAFYNSGTVVTPAIIARSHLQGSIAIVAGEFIQSDVYGAVYNGAMLFTDYGTGKVDFAVYNADGTVRTTDQAVGNIGAPADIVPGPDGYMYVVDLIGNVSKLEKA